MKIAAAALLILSTTAFAGEHGREGGVNLNLRVDPRTSATAKAEGGSALSVSEGGSAIAYGGSGGAGGHGGAGGIGLGGSGGDGGLGMGGTGGVSNSGGNTLSVNEVHPDKITIRQVASFGVADINPTAGCMGGASATLSTGFFGIGGGKSYINEHCVRQELARYYTAQGRADVGDEILCKSKFMKGISVCKVQ